ncbi:MAG: glycosyltransferase family 9 protein [bacterium]
MGNNTTTERGSSLLRVMDKGLGIPLLRSLGLIHNPRPLPEKISSIALLRTNAIGDTILLSGVIKDLKQQYSEAEILFFTGGSNHEIARCTAGSDRVIQLPVTNPFKSINILREHDFDVLIDFGQWPRIDALLSWGSGADFTVGFETKDQYRHYTYDRTVRHSPDVHEIENFRRLVSELGVESRSDPSIELPDIENPKRLSPTSNEFVVFHPWPGGLRSDLKQWPADRWVKLADWVVSQDLDVVITGSKADRESTGGLINRMDSGRVHSVAGELSLVETGHLLTQSRATVSVDTGIAHLSAVLDVPTVSLHGPSFPERWGPIGKHVYPIKSEDDRCGYMYLGFESPDQPLDCMESITVETVFHELQSVL